MVTYNTRDLTVAALRALLDGDHRCDLRVLVRDNGSSDGTPDALGREVPEAELDAGHDNVGFAAGVNTLLARSDAPWLFLLNSDAWPEPGAIAALVSSAERWPRAAVVAPRIERPDGTLEHSTHPFPSLGVAALLATSADHCLPQRRRSALCLEGSWSHDVAREVDWAVAAAWLMRRGALADVGPLDETFFMYAEDLEWCWRARRRGWAIRFEPSAVVRHLGNASGAQAYGSTRTAAYFRNTYRLLRRERGAAVTALYRGLNLLGASRGWVLSRIRRDEGAARWWGEQVRAHLISTRGPDGPPRP